MWRDLLGTRLTHSEVWNPRGKTRQPVHGYAIVQTDSEDFKRRALDSAMALPKSRLSYLRKTPGKHTGFEIAAKQAWRNWHSHERSSGN